MGSGLRSVLNSFFSHTLVHNDTSDLGGQKKGKIIGHDNGGHAFQMPLHYPRYTKADYKAMEEGKVDMLLREYGLNNHIKGTLEEKREFAMGTFLWPNQV